MKKFKKGNVIIRTNDPHKEKELKLRGFEEVKEKQKKTKKASSK
mgnify:FL=1